MDYFCEMLDFVTDEQLEKLIRSKQRKLSTLFLIFDFSGTEKFVKNIEEVFYVSANFDHNFDFKTNVSKSLRTVHSEIVREIQEKYGKAFKIIDLAGWFTSIFFLWILVK